MFAHDLIFQLHGVFFKLTEECFDAIHYGGMAFYKLFIGFFYVVPYIALCLAS